MSMEKLSDTSSRTDQLVSLNQKISSDTGLLITSDYFLLGLSEIKSETSFDERLDEMDAILGLGKYAVSDSDDSQPDDESTEKSDDEDTTPISRGSLFALPFPENTVPPTRTYDDYLKRFKRRELKTIDKIPRQTNRTYAEAHDQYVQETAEQDARALRSIKQGQNAKKLLPRMGEKLWDFVTRTSKPKSTKKPDIPYVAWAAQSPYIDERNRKRTNRRALALVTSIGMSIGVLVNGGIGSSTSSEPVKTSSPDKVVDLNDLPAPFDSPLSVDQVSSTPAQTATATEQARHMSDVGTQQTDTLQHDSLYDQITSPTQAETTVNSASYGPIQTTEATPATLPAPDLGTILPSNLLSNLGIHPSAHETILKDFIQRSNELRNTQYRYAEGLIYNANRVIYAGEELSEFNQSLIASVVS